MLVCTTLKPCARAMLDAPGIDVRVQTEIAWAGFIWDKAILRETSTLMDFVCGRGNAPPDHHLDVPWSHPDDGPWEDDQCWYRVRAKNDRYRFGRAANGVWVLMLADNP